MARKRNLFLHHIKSLLKRCKRLRFMALFLLGLILTLFPWLPGSAWEPATRGSASSCPSCQMSGSIVAGGRVFQLADRSGSRERERLEKAEKLNQEGSQLLVRGEAAAALENWEKAEELYRNAGNQIGVIGSQINQAQALEALGHYTKSCDRIMVAFGSEYKCEELTEKKLAQELDRFQVVDESLNFKGLQSLGNMLRRIGKLEESQLVLKTSKDKVRSAERLSQAWLNLGNTVRSLWKRAEDIDNTEQADKHYKNALHCYRKAVLYAKSPKTQVMAKLNLLSFELKDKNKSLSIEDARNLLSEVKEQIAQQQPSKMTVYARINLACSLIGCDRVYAVPGNKEASKWPFLEIKQEIKQLLLTAIGESEILQNKRFQSLAMGTLGTLYEKTGELRKAKSMTEEAIKLAKSIEADDIAYQWEWQMGRLLKQEGDVKGAIAYYREAFQTLNSVRYELFSINDVEFSFRLKVEPVYRQLVDLLISTDGGAGVSQASEKNSLKEAVEVIDALRLAELENYLDCNISVSDRAASDREDTEQVPKKEIEIEDVDDKAAFIYPIILPDRLEIIFKLPGSDWQHRSQDISKQDIEETINRLETNLRRPSGTIEVKEDGQELYNWLIKPLEKDLEILKNSGALNTLVFGLDNSLRNIPMAVLYNQEKYLIENYAIAGILSRQLFEYEPGPRFQEQFKNVLTAGVGEEQEAVEGETFPKLKYVSIELDKIQEVMGLTQDPLLDEVFTQDKLERQIDSAIFPIIHIATHGRFSSDPDQTFIVAWNQLIKVKELEKILRIDNPDRSKAIELLVLSACETAQGNRRAALGLAGVAVQARIPSTVATLWKVDDIITSQFMGKFYENLNNEMTVAEALQQAQQFILNEKDDRTYFWAPYILVGNWL